MRTIDVSSSTSASVTESNIRNLKLANSKSIPKGDVGLAFPVMGLAVDGTPTSPGVDPRAAIEANMVGLFQPPAKPGVMAMAKASPPLDGRRVGNITPPGPLSTSDLTALKSALEVAPGLAANLDSLEIDFMNSNCVATPDVTEKDLVAKFNKTEMADEPQDVEEYFSNVIEPVVDDSIHCCAPTMIGHMTTSLPYYMRPLAKLLTTIHANNVKVETGKTTTFIEKEAIAMLHRRLFNCPDNLYDVAASRPDTVLGVVTSGGTIANNTAMWIARNKAFPADGDYKGCDKQGMFQGLLHYKYTGAVIIGSEVMHYSMKKSADVLGIGTEGLLTCPFTDKYQVDVSVMRKHIEHCRANNIAIISLVGVAGGTETGSIDDLNAIADLAEEFGLHFHVDAAWGGPVIFSEEHKHKIAGIERANTVTLDGHKQLYTPMGCGLCFLREPDQIRCVEKTANYIIRKDSYDLGKFTMEGSRPAVSLFLHANLEIMGIEGYAALVDRSIRLVQYMVKALKATGQFEEVLEPMTNILLYRYVPKQLRDKAALPGGLSVEENAEVDRMNVALQNAQKKKGTTFVSRTTIFSPKQQCRVVALRVVIANPLTNNSHIDATLADQLEIVGGIDA